jgi:hypothetical protein
LLSSISPGGAERDVRRGVVAASMTTLDWPAQARRKNWLLNTSINRRGQLQPDKQIF